MLDRVVAIVQARMGSTRLPGKVLMEIADRPMLYHVVSRTSVASQLDETAVATTSEREDDRIADYCDEVGFPFTRGEEQDVLDRYYEAAVETDASVVVRVTGDCPLISPSFIDRAVRTYRETEADYVSNKVRYTQPDGLDVEVFSFEALETARNKADDDYDREHVTPYVRDNFAVQDVSNPIDTSSYACTDEETILRWTVDYPSDMDFVRAIFDRLYVNGRWTIDQVAVFELLEREPQLLELTQHGTPEEYRHGG